MASDAASTSRASFRPAARATAQSDELWISVVGSIYTVLRACHGIYEFTGDPDCMFRIALTPAAKTVTLADGTRIRRGDPVGALHWRNEHLRRYSARGPDLGWARDMRRRICHSMMLLADYVEHDPGWRDVQALRGDATFSS